MYSVSTKYSAKERGEKMKNKVKHYRELKGWSQEKLAEESEVSRNTISAIETEANTNVTYEVMKKIAKALDKKVVTIFFNQ